MFVRQAMHNRSAQKQQTLVVKTEFQQNTGVFFGTHAVFARVSVVSFFGKSLMSLDILRYKPAKLYEELM